jgi:hypothetical protein
MLPETTNSHAQGIPASAVVETVAVHDADNSAVFNYSAVLARIPTRIQDKLNIAADKIVKYSEDSKDWVSLFEKKGVVAYRREGEGPICVKGEMMFPYTIPEIFAYLCVKQHRKDLDGQVDIYDVNWLSHHSGVEYVKTKGFWPTAPRDFCSICHWRLLKDGRFIMLNEAENSNLYPESDGAVRGHVLMGGYVMRHVPGGTLVKIIVQVRRAATFFRRYICLLFVQCELGGSLPVAVTTMAAHTQPMVLVTFKRLLDEKFRGKPRPNFSTLPPVSYEGTPLLSYYYWFLMPR